MEDPPAAEGRGVRRGKARSSLSSEGTAAAPTSQLAWCSPALLWSVSVSPTFLTRKMRMLSLQGVPLHFSRTSCQSVGPQEGTGVAGLSLSADYSLLLTFIYNGHVVGEAQVQSLDCRLLAEPSSSQCSMEQVIFPKPGPCEPAQRLLSQLQRGVLLASNSRGLFVQRLCPIPISWNAPQMPPGLGPHLLPSNECVELFRTSYFCRGEAATAKHLNPFPYPLSPPLGRPSPCTPSSQSPSTIQVWPLHLCGAHPRAQPWQPPFLGQDHRR